MFVFSIGTGERRLSTVAFGPIAGLKQGLVPVLSQLE
jgi:hypothetical protein